MWTRAQAEAFEVSLFSRARAIVGPKRTDYSGQTDPYANFRKSVQLGVEPWRGALVRLTDKISRIVSIMEHGGTGSVKDEALIDTFADALNYVAISGGLAFEALGFSPEDLFGSGPSVGR